MADDDDNGKNLTGVVAPKGLLISQRCYETLSWSQ